MKPAVRCHVRHDPSPVASVAHQPNASEPDPATKTAGSSSKMLASRRNDGGEAPSARTALPSRAPTAVEDADVSLSVPDWAVQLSSSVTVGRWSVVRRGGAAER